MGIAIGGMVSALLSLFILYGLKTQIPNERRRSACWKPIRTVMTEISANKSFKSTEGESGVRSIFMF
jgi:hypothetical protein